MNANLVDLLAAPQREAADRIYGVATGIVTNNQDPENMGRVRVRFPWLSESDESWWARVAAPMAGKKRGTYFLPEVDDEVLVAFDRGDPRFPYILGGLWNGEDEPPETNDDGKNNRRILQSRSGHVVRLDDTEGGEKIEIVDAKGAQSIVFDTANKSITITADSDIVLEAKNGKLKLSANGVEIASQAAVKVEASQNLDLDSKAQVNVKGSVINLN
jgi:uncharacterized protein involved in type VI secretion and phage assembly